MDMVSTLVVAKSIENSIDIFKPTIVYTTPGIDVNVDHKKVFNATLVATRPKKKTKVEQVISYEIPSSSEWFFPEQFSPNIFENIEKEFSSKIRAIKSYKNELMEFPHPRSVDALEAITKRWGTVSGYKYAEAFKLIRLLKK
jgi:LmbE family N-acetylglucosaminyl deacetylase